MTTMAQSHENISSAASVLEIESHDDITTSFDQEVCILEQNLPSKILIWINLHFHFLD